MSMADVQTISNPAALRGSFNVPFGEPLPLACISLCPASLVSLPLPLSLSLCPAGVPLPLPLSSLSALPG